ncbi:hypothetical protein OG762_46910 (plasmid) [Streptomyces sp. NBC_01136]|uniref:hypothetical protein n=1 Tax=Streptomyces sp. NBC_01136 TaxID=2903754 RepID=UPI002F91060E|nr:hypothetical protein OG762_46910 [Streptomyces sp. NBC_01136]
MIDESPTFSACPRGPHEWCEEVFAEVLAEATGAAGGVTPRMAAALVAAVHRVLFRPIQDLTLGGRASPETAEIVADEASRCVPSMCWKPGLADRAVRPGGCSRERAERDEEGRRSVVVRRVTGLSQRAAAANGCATVAGTAVPAGRRRVPARSAR